MNQTQALHSSSFQCGGQERPRLGKSSFVCSMHRPWETDEKEVSQGSLECQGSEKDSSRGHPTSGPHSHAEVT